MGSEVISLPAVSTQNDDSPPITSLIDNLSDSTHLTHPSPDLNDSLASISFFDHTHQGQLGRTSAGALVILFLTLTLSTCISIDEGDLLETFLTDYQQMKRGSSSQTTGHLPDREGEGEGEREGIGFSTPELPTGQQLLLNLLTTWGDQFYIGLSGIEIFTASGDRACVEEVHTHTNKITNK